MNLEANLAQRISSQLNNDSQWLQSQQLMDYSLFIGEFISASPTACPLRGYGRAGTQNDRLGEAVTLSTGTPIPA